MSNDFVNFQVPAFHHLSKASVKYDPWIHSMFTDLIFSTRKQIWMSWRNCQTSNSRNVPRQTKLQLSRSEVPNFYDTITGTRHEPFVSRLNSNRTYPTKVSGDDAHEFPLRMISRLDCSSRFVQSQSLGESWSRSQCRRLLCWYIINFCNYLVYFGRS